MHYLLPTLHTKSTHRNRLSVIHTLDCLATRDCLSNVAIDWFMHAFNLFSRFFISLSEQISIKCTYVAKNCLKSILQTIDGSHFACNFRFSSTKNGSTLAVSYVIIYDSLFKSSMAACIAVLRLYLT